MDSITQDMKYRYSLMKYAEKYGVSRDSRKYDKSRECPGSGVNLQADAEQAVRLEVLNMPGKKRAPTGDTAFCAHPFSRALYLDDIAFLSGLGLRGRNGAVAQRDGADAPQGLRQAPFPQQGLACFAVENLPLPVDPYGGKA